MSQRIARINELLKREISAVLEKSFEFPGVLVTVHAVETAPDLKASKVFIGVIGSETDQEEIIRELNSKRGFIQGVVMKRVVLRYTPQLTFLVDDSVERGVRVLNILDELGDIELPEDSGENP
ncbi:MAG: 30S ribosome-binding factor RbfA [Verrucomicrobiota bacterium]